jgi:hypothetical protein
MRLPCKILFKSSRRELVTVQLRHHHLRLPECTGLQVCTASITTDSTVRRSAPLNPDKSKSDPDFLKDLQQENEVRRQQRQERRDRIERKRQKRQQKEDSAVSDTESVISTSSETNTGKAHQDARDQFDAYLADLKQNLQLLERTAEKPYRLDVIRSRIRHYQSTTRSIKQGDAFKNFIPTPKSAFS